MATMTPIPVLDRTSATFRADVDELFGVRISRFVTEANVMEANVEAKSAAAVSAAGTAAAARDQAVTARDQAVPAAAQATAARDAVVPLAPQVQQNAALAETARQQAEASAAQARQVALNGDTGYPPFSPSMLNDWANSRFLSPVFNRTRALAATYTDALGRVRSVFSGEPVFEWDATGRCRGLRVEPARTNGIRNNTMQGASAGTPGSNPTNWVTGAPSGVSRSVVGIGVEDGVEYIDFRFFGTATAAATCGIAPETGTGVSAVAGQTWTASWFVRRVDGAFPGTVYINVSERTAAAYLTESTAVISPSDGPLAGQRFAHTRTLSNASTAYVLTSLSVIVPAGAIVDFTMRVGLPQLEQGASASSPIRTATATVTRPADVITLPAAEASQSIDFKNGAVLVEFTLNAVPDTDTWHVMSLHGNAANRIIVRCGPGAIRIYVVGGGNTQATVNQLVAVPVPGQRYRIAFAFSPAGIRASMNGAAVVTSVVPALYPVGLNQLSVGHDRGTDQLNGHIACLHLYSTPPSDVQLRAMSGL